MAHRSTFWGPTNCCKGVVWRRSGSVGIVTICCTRVKIGKCKDCCLNAELAPMWKKLEHRWSIDMNWSRTLVRLPEWCRTSVRILRFRDLTGNALSVTQEKMCSFNRSRGGVILRWFCSLCAWPAHISLHLIKRIREPSLFKLVCTLINYICIRRQNAKSEANR